MKLLGNTHGVLRPKKLSRSMRFSLLLLLLALALTTTVSFAQDGGQAPHNEVNLEVEQPPPNPEPEPPEITLPPTQPGEELYIAEVAIESAEQLATLQQLGYSCAEAQACEIVATEAQLSVLQEAGFKVDVVGIVVESSPQDGLGESSRYGSNYIDYTIPDWGSASSPIGITGAPAGARVTRVKYDCMVVRTGILGGPGQYTLEIRPASMLVGCTIWNRLGGATDEGHDDDTADDTDIYLNGRWVNAHFDGQPVNQTWYLQAIDHTLTYFGAGKIDYWRLWGYYCTSGPSAPTLQWPANAHHTCDTTPAFDWSSVTGADRYNIQVDDSSTFASPAINISPTPSNYTPTAALTRKGWYWRVRAHNECGYGPWSSTNTFFVDSFPAVPVLQLPANGSHTCDTTPYFNWANAAGATSYRIQVDDSPTFLSPAINIVRTVSNYPTASALAPGHYYWRVRGQSACGNSAPSSVRNFTIDPTPATPSNPLPANNATGVPTNADLDWANAAGATGYAVYFGTSPIPPYVGTVAASQYNLPTLAANTMYYWKIVARNAGCQTSGPLWRFRTVAPAINYAPTNGTITPNSGAAPAGNIVYFTSTYFDLNGNGDLKACRLHIGRVAAPKSLAGNAVLNYHAPSNTLRIRNNAGTKWWGGKAVGSANVIQNNQAKVYCNLTTVTKVGNMIQVRWAVQFKPAFRGRTKMYLKARDMAGLTSALQQKGTWTVQ